MRTIQEKIRYQPKEKTGILEKAFVEVMLGRASAKCKHLGICKIESVRTNDFSQYASAFCKPSNGIFALANLKKELYFELIFEKKFLRKAVFEKYFESGFFKMEEGYTVDSSLMGTAAYLPKGDYKIKFSDTLLSVRFLFGKVADYNRLW